MENRIKILKCLDIKDTFLNPYYIEHSMKSLILMGALVAVSLAFISTQTANADVLFEWGMGDKPTIDNFTQNTDNTWNLTFTVPDGVTAYGNLNDGQQNYKTYDNPSNIRIIKHLGTQTYTLDEGFPKYFGSCVLLQITYSGSFGNSNQIICP